MKKLIVIMAMVIMSVVSMADQLTDKGIDYLEILGYKVETIDNGYSIKDVDADAECQTLTFEETIDARKFLFNEEIRLEEEGFAPLSYDRDSMVWANNKTMVMTGYCITDGDIFSFKQNIQGKDSNIAKDTMRAIGMQK